MEQILAWGVPFLGLPMSWLSLQDDHDFQDVSRFSAAILVALVLVICLILVSIFINSLCISWHLCRSHGDMNMSYWFKAFYLSPLYVVFALVGASRKN